MGIISQNFQIINNKSFSQLYGKKMLSFREFLNETSGTTGTTVKPKKKSELIDIIEDTISEEGTFNCDLNFIDTSAITDMRELFCFFDDFNGDISKWDVSNVEDMDWMFKDSNFNGDISKWNTSSVKTMEQMFNNSKFNRDISKWDVSNVRDMSHMFMNSKFNQDISKWDVSNVEDMYCMFFKSKFNGDISQWDVSKVKDMANMFYGSNFNGDIS